MDNKPNKKFQSNHKYFTICIYAIITFAVCIIIFRFLNNWEATKARLSSILATFSPFLIAYFINPLVATIDRFLFGKTLKNRFIRVHKVISLILAYIVVVGFIVMVLTFVIPEVIASISELVRQSTYMPIIIQNKWSSFVVDHPTWDLDAIQTFIDQALPDLIDYVKTFMTNAVPMIYNASVSIISWVVNILLAFVISCYIMMDKKTLIGGFKKIIYSFVSQDLAHKVIVTTKECNQIFSRYIIGKALDSLIIGIICFVFMTIVNLPYSILISLVVGITNMIPYFGPFIGAVPGVLLLLIISPKSALIFAIWIFVLQQFDGAILGPKILGNSTGLQPIWIIFAITVGGSLGGVLGMFLGVPIVAVLAYLLTDLTDFLLKKRDIHPDLSNIKYPDDLKIPEHYPETKVKKEENPK